MVFNSDVLLSPTGLSKHVRHIRVQQVFIAEAVTEAVTEAVAEAVPDSSAETDGIHEYHIRRLHL